MKFRCRLPRLIGIILLLAFTLSSCGEGHVCEGLNNGTGSANTSRGARKKNRGGYKSPRELDARDRQKKRIRKHKRQSLRKSHGGGNTAGRRNFNSDFDLNINGNTDSSVQETY